MAEIDTRIFQIDPHNPDTGLLREAAAYLQAGKLVAFPTETVYGLGANALDIQALRAIFAAKGRPDTDPLIVHLAELSQLDSVAEQVPDLAYHLAQHFWPGPLTLVMRRAASVPGIVSAGLDTVAVRIPAHPLARALIAAAERPIAAPSANRFARPSPTTAAHVLADLDGRIDLVVDGGPCSIGVESTVLDLSRDRPVVLRPGGIALETLRRFLPELQYVPRYLSSTMASSAPGGMLRHYAPDTPLTLFTGEAGAVLAHIRAELERRHRAGQKVGLLLPEEDLALLHDMPATSHNLGSLSNLAAIATRLFAGLRELDSVGLDCILTRDIQHEGLGLAIWDRLLRAADGRVVHIE